MTKPKRLFRYFPPRASDILVEQKLWLSAVKDFNDVFEVVPRWDALLSELIDRQVKQTYAFLPRSAQIDWKTYKKGMTPHSEQLKRESLERLPDDFQTKFSERFRVACFCENRDSLLMWGHYTDCHQGFVVEFDPQHALFSTKAFGKVEYSEKRPLMRGAKEHRKILLTKSPEWKYEQEHRLIKPVGELTAGKRSDGKEGYYMPLPLEAIKVVYFGCRILPQCRDQLLRSLSSPSSTHINAYIMQRHDTDYGLVAVPWAEWTPPAPDPIANFMITDFTAGWKRMGF